MSMYLGFVLFGNILYNHGENSALINPGIAPVLQKNRIKRVAGAVYK